jgi:hypothetical protein
MQKQIIKINFIKNLHVTNVLTGTFKCSLERAFKTPILGDVTKILTGYGGFQIVAGVSHDATWGIAGGKRRLIMNGFLFTKNKEHGLDQIFVRDENKFWKWGVSEMGTIVFFAKKNCGKWWVTDNNNGEISVKWEYIWFSRNILTHPINWIFVKIFWKKVMNNGMKNIREMAEKEIPYIYCQ